MSAVLPVVVVGAALHDRGRLLAARRSAPPAHAGGWELPGGKVEPGETELDALHRELREELGVEIRVGNQVGGDWPLDDGYVLRVWLAEVVAGVPQPLQDHDRLRWVPFDEVAAVGWLDGDAPVVAAAVRALQDAGAPPRGRPSGATVD